MERLPIYYALFRGAMYIACRTLRGYLVWVCRGKKQRGSKVGSIKARDYLLYSKLSVLGSTQGSKHNFPYVF